jgi:hypothetical protein
VRSALARGTTLREHFKDLNPLVAVRLVTAVPGVEYYGKVLSVGTDHVVLETDFHVVTVALSGVISVYRDHSRGSIPAESAPARHVAQSAAQDEGGGSPRSRRKRNVTRARFLSRGPGGWRSRLSRQG